MDDTVYIQSKISMEKSIELFKRYINKIRTDRASSSLLDDIKIKYFDKLTPLNQVSSIIVENNRTLVVNVFDNTLISAVMKSIITADLNLNPTIHENTIYVPLPPLTVEYRHSMIKLIRSEAEKIKISIRNIRRDANNKIKLLFKKKLIHENQEDKYQKKIQKITDFYIIEINNLLLKKEKELMTF